MRPPGSRMVSDVSELDRLLHAAARASSGTRAAAATALDALPWLDSAIRDDAAAGLFATWGRSTIVDENTGAAVIPEALFDELHARAGLAASWPHGNAGLLHCYGYLLSVEPTPYGLKRDRWLGDDLATACGLPADAFLPWTPGATLLARATTAAASLLAGPADSVRDRVVDSRRARLALGATEGTTALAYAVAPTPTSAPLLVTLFPVADPVSVLAVFENEQRLHWNAV